jgi:hypothetical protein
MIAYKQSIQLEQQYYHGDNTDGDILLLAQPQQWNPKYSYIAYPYTTTS